MTSTPVTAGIGTFFKGQVPAGTPTGSGVETSFSDVLKNQKSDQKAADTGKRAPKVKAENDTNKADNDRVKPEDTAKSENTANQTKATDTKDAAGTESTKEASDAADKMLKKTAEKLGMSEEELLMIMNSLSLTPMDLLQAENLQAVLLAAAGETDACSMVTNEDLFTTFKDLTAELEQVLQEISEATGMDVSEVKEFLEVFADQAQKSEVLAETLPEEDEFTEKKPEAKDGVAAATSVQEENAPDGAKIMLERSLEKDSDADRGEGRELSGQTNPFAQEMAVSNQTESVQAAPESAGYFDADTEMIFNQITDYIKGQITDGVSEVEMQLHPESLGTLHIRLTAKDGMLTAQFTAQNDAVKAALEGQMIQLKETFKEQGMSVEAIEVTVESHKFDQNFSENRGSMQQNDRRPSKQARRQINLNTSIEEEDLTEEEQLAAQVLRDSGGTVDYTA